MAVHYCTCVCCITHIAPWRNGWKCNGLTLCCCWLLFGQCYYVALVLVHLANSTRVIADSNHFETVLAKLFSSVLKVKRDVRTFFLASYSYLCTLHFTPESLYVYVYFVMVVVLLYSTLCAQRALNQYLFIICVWRKECEYCMKMCSHWLPI